VSRADIGCTACGECERACPFRAITISDDGPAINPDRCKGCGRCETACSEGVLSVHPLEMVPTYEGGWQMVPAEAFVYEILKIIS
jgi:ferredoxin